MSYEIHDQIRYFKPNLKEVNIMGGGFWSTEEWEKVEREVSEAKLSRFNEPRQKRSSGAVGEGSGQKSRWCFVATTCFGEESEEVAALRKYRDDVLIWTEGGRAFVQCYYHIGRHIATAVGMSGTLLKITRSFLRAVIKRV